jgi:uncharacterized protein
MAQLSIISLILFILLSLMAEVLGTIGGFGSSVFFVPLANYFLDFQSVLGIVALFHLMSNTSKIALFRNGIDKNTIIKLGIPAIILAFAGSYLSQFADTKLLELFLAIFLLVTSLVFLIKREIAFDPNTVNSAIGGGLSGFLAGLVGTGGAVRGIAMTAFNLEKEVFVATSAVIDLGIDLTRAGVYLSNGFIHKHDLYLIPFLLIISIVGTFLGKKILNYLPQDRFKLVVLILILITGLITLLRASTFLA